MYSKKSYNQFALDCRHDFDVIDITHNKYHGPAVKCASIKDVKSVIYCTEIDVKHECVDGHFLVMVAD